LTLFKVKLKN